MNQTDLLFATANPNKVSEVNALLEGNPKIITPAQIGFTEEVEETGTTFSANALLKVKALQPYHKGPIFSEDTGLAVDALQGRPGVKTARFAGENASHADNIGKLLAELKNSTNRQARFITVACLWWQGSYHYFEGVCEGTISKDMRGSEGFGYDPVFIPEGFDQTFAELGDDVKKQLSHRSLAINKLVAFIKKKPTA